MGAGGDASSVRAPHGSVRAPHGSVHGPHGSVRFLTRRLGPRAADGSESDSASTDGTDSDEELKLHGPSAVSPERPSSMRRKSSGVAGPGDAGAGGDTLEIYYRCVEGVGRRWGWGAGDGVAQ